MSTVDLSPRTTWRKRPACQSETVSKLNAYPTAWWTMCIASLIALATSSYLAWASFASSGVAGCGGGGMFDCNHVLHSRWSTVLSIPVSVPAIVTHALILGMLVWQPVSQRFNQVRWTVIGFASLAAGAAAVWFIGLQVFLLQHLCPYCLVAHIAGVVLAITYLMSRPVDTASLRWTGIGAAASLAALIGLQSLNEMPLSYEVIQYDDTAEVESAAPASRSVNEEATLFEAPVESKKQAKLLDLQAASLFVAIIHPAMLMQAEVAANREPAHTASVLNDVKLDTSAWPLLGRPDAELVFVELFDYTCPHCQRTHQSLEAVRKQFGDRLAVITLPVPLDGKCNPTVKQTRASHNEACELAKLAVTVWAIDRDKFADFHSYLFDQRPNYAQALAQAQSQVDRDKIDETLQSKVPSEYIAKHIALYQQAGAGTIPKLLFPKTSIVGAVESPEAMTQLIQKNLSHESR